MGLTSTGKNRRIADASARALTIKTSASRVGRLLVRVAIAIAVIAGATFGGITGWKWLHTSPTFSLQRISFTGLKRASESDLLKLAEIESGQNLFSLDVALTEKAMAQHPWVRSVELSRRFPSSLTVNVVEHEPAALVALSELYLADADGTPFRRVQPGDALDLLLITGIARDAYVEDSAGTAKRVAAAIALARAYQQSAAGKGAALSEVRVEGNGFNLITLGGEEIRLGEVEVAAGGDVEEKLSRLAQVHKELAAKSVRASVIRLDNRARPGWVAITVAQTGSERTGRP